MVKINFNTPIPHCQRDKFLHAMRDLGFSYERIYQSGENSLFKFTGKLPTSSEKTNVDVQIVDDDLNINDFQQLLVGYVEMYFMIERS